MVNRKIPVNDSHGIWMDAQASGLKHHSPPSHYQVRCPSSLWVLFGIITLPSSHFWFIRPLLTMAKMSLASRALRWRMSRRKTTSRKRKPKSTWPRLLRMLLKALKGREKNHESQAIKEIQRMNSQISEKTQHSMFSTTNLFIRFRDWRMIREHL